MSRYCDGLKKGFILWLALPLIPIIGLWWVGVSILAGLTPIIRSLFKGDGP